MKKATTTVIAVVALAAFAAPFAAALSTDLSSGAEQACGGEKPASPKPGKPKPQKPKPIQPS